MGWRVGVEFVAGVRDCVRLRAVVFATGVLVCACGWVVFVNGVGVCACGWVVLVNGCACGVGVDVCARGASSKQVDSKESLLNVSSRSVSLLTAARD